MGLIGINAPRLKAIADVDHRSRCHRLLRHSSNNDGPQALNAGRRVVVITGQLLREAIMLKKRGAIVPALLYIIREPAINAPIGVVASHLDADGRR